MTQDLTTQKVPAAGGAQEIGQPFALSPAQERIWSAWRSNPADTSWNGSFRINLAGPVDAAVLERTFNLIIRRHAILRATIHEANGAPGQTIAPELHLRLGTSDLRGVPGELREAEMDRLCAEEAQKPFDLATAPLFRAGLLQMEDQRFILTLTLHQVVCDGWSIGLLMEELQQIYAAFAAGRPPSLPPLPLQYTDYVQQLYAFAATPEAQQQLRYWKSKLRNCARLEIGADAPSNNRDGRGAAIISHLLPHALTDTLREQSTAQGGTFFTTTLAAFFALLHRYTGMRDLAVGSPLAGRNRTELEGLVGQFVNHVVFRADASGDPVFTDFAAGVRETVWEAFGNQDLPFETVLRALRPSGDPYQPSICSINFICQREYGRAAKFNFDFAGIRMSTMPSKTQGALYDLNFFLVEREAGWRLSLEYRTGLYLEQTARGLLDHFKELLEGIASNPSRRLSEYRLAGKLPALAPEGLAASQAAAEDELYAMPSSVVQQRFWLLSQLDRHNAAMHMPACVRIQGQLSTSVLEQALEFLVRRHEVLRTTFEEIDGELMQVISPAKQPPLPIIDLRALPEKKREMRLQTEIRTEAGAPFDLTAGPLFRFRIFQMEDSECVLMLTIHHILADGWSHKIIQDDLWAAYAAIAGGTAPDLPPLVIQYSDFTTWQKEWLATDEAQAHLDYWLRKLAGDLPVANLPTDRPPSLRPASHGAIETLLLPAELVAALKARAQSKNVTMFMLALNAFAVLLNRQSGQEDLLIGSPVANRRAETELLVGPFAGPVCLRLDYSGNPTLAQCLDRVRDTTLDALSHTDLPFEALLDRIKVRTVKGRKPLFQFYFFYQSAFLKPREAAGLHISPLPTFSTGVPFELQLAMIEREEGLRAQLEYNPDLFDAGTIQGLLRDYAETLTHFEAGLDTRLADLAASRPLPAAKPAEKERTSKPARPPDDYERKLTVIFENVLGVRSVGVRQDFFELGGNSLIAARMFAQIEKTFGMRLPLATLFEATTIEEIAEVLRSEKLAPQWSSLVEIQGSGSRPPFFCVHGAGGNVLIYRELSRHLGDDQPFYGLQSQGLDGRRPVLTRIEDMAAAYLKEMRRIRPHGPYLLGGYCLGGTIALEMARQLRESGEQVALLAMFDTLNWAALRPRNRFDKWRYQLERLAFHAGNFHLLNFKGKREFLYEKLRAVKSRLSVWRGMLFGRFLKASGGASNAILLAYLWHANDRAAVIYRPKPYPGAIADFQPVRQYSIYKGPDIHWDKIALDGSQVTTLRVYPAGMLVEPFVKNLAAALREKIDRAIGTSPAQE
jgi:non-ribosomal peptide synthetase component F/thioesterase domain-containing protein